jgi:hypothetical protein
MIELPCSIPALRWPAVSASPGARLVHFFWLRGLPHGHGPQQLRVLTMNGRSQPLGLE